MRSSRTAWAGGRTVVAALAVASAATLMLAGCTAAVTDAEGAASTTPPATAGTRSPTPTPAAPPVTCENALLPGGYAEFEAQGLRPDAFTTWGPNPDRRIEALVIAGPGITCSWRTAEGDGLAYFAQIAMSEAEWAKTKAELQSDGFVEQETPVPGYFNGPTPDPLYGDGGFSYRDGFLYYTLTPGLTKWVPGLSSLPPE
ncbi:hypothetical protein RCH16_002445 [Cryobacterium sp. MP_M5]|uniref:hypothetical protein n=1 Tax=unclassified Cryobacterium TaxID=2649013 RepID=UPI0018C9AFFB|nr:MULTISPECIES: hypothetical protein [unclassified Cryobacterium]MBG6059139.1 hypothetical protein [Cryobacterium sp. MP_M3]MEC5177432.1 hypothetical protein [Cryobacterium sp. MP_M5]